MLFFNFTGAIYIITGLIILILGLRAYQYYKKDKNYLSKMTSFACFLMGSYGFLIGFLLLFFSSFQPILKVIIISAPVFQGLFLAFLSKIIIHLKFPTISPNYGFFFVLAFTLVILILNFFYYNPPSVNEWGFVNWNIHPLIAYLRVFLFLTIFGPLGWFFFREAKVSDIPKVKLRAFAFGIVLWLAILYFTFDLILKTTIPSQNLFIITELILFFSAIIILFFVLFKGKKIIDFFLNIISGGENKK